MVKQIRPPSVTQGESYLLLTIEERHCLDLQSVSLVLAEVNDPALDLWTNHYPLSIRRDHSRVGGARVAETQSLLASLFSRFVNLIRSRCPLEESGKHIYYLDRVR